MLDPSVVHFINHSEVFGVEGRVKDLRVDRQPLEGVMEHSSCKQQQQMSYLLELLRLDQLLFTNNNNITRACKR